MSIDHQSRLPHQAGLSSAQTDCCLPMLTAGGKGSVAFAAGGGLGIIGQTGKLKRLNISDYLQYL